LPKYKGAVTLKIGVRTKFLCVITVTVIIRNVAVRLLRRVILKKLFSNNTIKLIMKKC